MDLSTPVPHCEQVSPTRTMITKSTQSRCATNTGSSCPKSGQQTEQPVCLQVADEKILNDATLGTKLTNASQPGSDDLLHSKEVCNSPIVHMPTATLRGCHQDTDESKMYCTPPMRCLSSRRSSTLSKLFQRLGATEYRNKSTSAGERNSTTADTIQIASIERSNHYDIYEKLLDAPRVPSSIESSIPVSAHQFALHPMFTPIPPQQKSTHVSSIPNIVQPKFKAKSSLFESSIEEYYEKTEERFRSQEVIKKNRDTSIDNQKRLYLDPPVLCRQSIEFDATFLEDSVSKIIPPILPAMDELSPNASADTTSEESLCRKLKMRLTNRFVSVDRH
jgi:hypothetical protein